MVINQSIKGLLGQLETTIAQLSEEQFRTPISIMGGSTIGEHVRHILEFYVELFVGYQTGLINYDDRKRDHQLQSVRAVAIFKIKQISSIPDRDDCHLKIALNDEGNSQTSTTYLRELLYNLDHTVHHMALIRIAVASVAKISLPDDFGVAASTVKYKKSCAQ